MPDPLRPLRSAARKLRRLVYHRDEFVICGAEIGELCLPEEPTEFRVEIVAPPQFCDLIEWSPHLTSEDVDDLRRRDSAAVVIRDADRVIALNFFVRGPGAAWVDEFDHDVPLRAGEHYSCRTFVDPDHRGRSLYDHMLACYIEGLDRHERVWGLVMTRNRPSLQMLHRLGWVGTGRWIATTRMGRLTTERFDHAPRPLA